MNYAVASFTQTEYGIRADVYVLGKRKSKTFRTKREAYAWASATETELRNIEALPLGERYTLGDALRRYLEIVTPTKRGKRWDEIRIEAMLSAPKNLRKESTDVALPIDKPIASCTPIVLGEWRDARLKKVSAGTVLRDFSLLSAVFEEARREWRWLPSNPCNDVRKPRAPDHRDVLISRPQIKAMLKALGYRHGIRPMSIQHAVAYCFLLALRSGMRAGELCGLEWSNVFEDYAHLPVTKTVKRNVDLSPKALRLIEAMRGFDDNLVFGLKVGSLDAMFRRARIKAGLEGFTFHDTRHTAATWISQKIHVLDLCKMFGWSDPKMAMTYYNPKAGSIARKL